MSKLKILCFLFVLLSPALAFSDCGGGKYKDCRCSLAVNNGFGNVSDVTVDYCCQYKCGGMGSDGDSRCCIGANQGKTWVGGVCKTPCSSVTCSSGQEKNGQTYQETTGTCCQTKAANCSDYSYKISHRSECCPSASQSDSACYYLNWYTNGSQQVGQGSSCGYNPTYHPSCTGNMNCTGDEDRFTVDCAPGVFCACMLCGSRGSYYEINTVVYECKAYKNGW